MIALLVPLCSHAQETTDAAPRLFDTEIIIFGHENTSDGGERWEVEPVLDETVSSVLEDFQANRTASAADNADGATATGHPEDAVAYTEREILGPHTHQLAPLARALTRSGRYTTYAHVAWREAVQPPDTAQPIEIAELVNPGASSGSPANSDEAVLSGTIRVSVARYLHLETDLRLDDGMVYMHTTDGDPVYSVRERPVYRLQQKRRMRSGELHYIDHPRFSVLALITPYIPPAPEPKPEIAEAAAPEPLATEPSSSTIPGTASSSESKPSSP